MKVCVIEDDSLVLLHLEEMLKRLGCQVLTAATVNEGLRIVEDWSPDAVLVDILMPDRDGLNFIMDTRHLRDSLRVIAMSGGGRLASSSILQMATGLGAHAALVIADHADLDRAHPPALADAGVQQRGLGAGIGADDQDRGEVFHLHRRRSSKSTECKLRIPQHMCRPICRRE